MARVALTECPADLKYDRAEQVHNEVGRKHVQGNRRPRGRLRCNRREQAQPDRAAPTHSRFGRARGVSRFTAVCLLPEREKEPARRQVDPHADPRHRRLAAEQAWRRYVARLSPYAKDKYGYDVSFSFADAPFGTLFQKAATSLATRSQEYNIIISDSQWLGALATPGWIVQLNDIIAKNPETEYRVVVAHDPFELSGVS